MSEPDEQFDDPALKSAIRKAVPADRAPDALRQRVVAALAREARPSPWRNPRVRLYAVAAMLVVGLGIGALMLRPKPEPPVPNWFADAMITTHDTCKTLADHRLVKDVAADDLVALRTRLHELLGHPALVALLGDGWKFNGAGMCEVNKVPAAHLMFSRGEDTVSIFSITSKLLYTNTSEDGLNYSQTRNGHELAGFVYGGAIHCLVVQSPTKKMGLRQVIDMRDWLRASPSGLGAERPPLRIAH